MIRKVVLHLPNGWGVGIVSTPSKQKSHKDFVRYSIENINNQITR